MKAFNICWDIDMDEVYEKLDTMSAKDAAKVLELSEREYAKMSVEDRHDWAEEHFRHCPGDLDAFLGLPDEVEIPSEVINDPRCRESRDVLIDYISNWLSDEYGYCHTEFGLMYKKKIAVSQDEAKVIQYAIDHNPESEEECFGEDKTITNTVCFEDGYKIDIKCCGVQYEEGGVNTAWGEAVLFNDKGCEIACTEPSDEYFGQWTLYSLEDMYIVDIEVEEAEAA